MRSDEHERVATGDLQPVPPVFLLVLEFLVGVAERRVRVPRFLIALLEHSARFGTRDPLARRENQRVQESFLVRAKRYCCAVTFGRPAIDHPHPEDRSGRRVRLSHRATTYRNPLSE